MKLFKIFHFHDLSLCIGIVKTSNEIILIVASDNYDNFRHLWFIFLTKVWVSTLKGLFYVESDPRCKGIYVGNGSPNLFIFKIKNKFFWRFKVQQQELGSWGGT